MIPHNRVRRMGPGGGGVRGGKDEGIKNMPDESSLHDILDPYRDDPFCSDPFMVTTTTNTTTSTKP